MQSSFSRTFHHIDLRPFFKRVSNKKRYEAQKKVPSLLLNSEASLLPTIEGMSIVSRPHAISVAVPKNVKKRNKKIMPNSFFFVNQEPVFRGWLRRVFSCLNFSRLFHAKTSLVAGCFGCDVSAV